MPLHVKLKPYERMIINGASIRNGDRSTDFIIENQCKFLRETEIVRESDADTDCKKLALIVQIIHLSNHSEETESLFKNKAFDIVRFMPQLASEIIEIQGYISENETHRAVKAVRKLIQLEHDLLNQVANNKGAA
ncbi:flagellar biosynthesis repressor FlbT [Methylorubrum rhodesianum]|uniref:flagellar biosynthesis repressor FlbT n=1 Tax=Methylorubrum rhodesianum TaxID=29427 RepID=UPI003D2E9D03